MGRGHDEHSGDDVNRRLAQKADTILSRERGTVFKEPGGRVNVCLAYPNTYHIGMSNLGFQGIYSMLNDRNDTLCERTFLPDDNDISEYTRTGTELFSLESRRPLNRFDIVAFSVSFENDYPNILKMLKLAKIPIRASDRGQKHPLLILGGACAFFNPEPVSEFFDVCFIGEAEEMLHEFMDTHIKSGSRNELLREACRIEGVYVPEFYGISYNNGILQRSALRDSPERVRRRYIKNISDRKFRQLIVTPETEFSNMYLIEAMRGCPWKCRFCVAGHIYGPARRKELSAIKKEITEALQVTDRVGLIGPSLTDYPHIEEALKTEGVNFSITSLRASKKSAEIAGLLKGHKSVSIAPEAGTERLRRVIDKKITEDDIIETSGLIFSEGIENLRLYFMVGLPTEADDDILAIANLVRKIRGLSKKGSVVLTLSTFVPKPFTPFQWHPMEKIEVVKARLKTLKKLLLPIDGIRLFHDVQKYAYMQGFFSMGDRRTAKVLENMLTIHDWKRASAGAGINPDFYIMRKKDFSESLPWDFIDSGISKERLWEEYRKALS